MQDQKCMQCELTGDDTKLHKCPVCFKHVCDEHAASRSGRKFCSDACAEYFFFGDPED